MRKLRENQPNRVYRLISRITHCAFYLNAAERDRCVDLMPRLCSVLLWGAVVGIASVSAADAFPNSAQAGGNAGSADTLEFHALAHPDSVLLDGRDAGRRVSVSDDGRVVLDGGTASFVEIIWAFPLGGKTRVLGGQWERTYGDVGWRPVKDAQAPRGGSMPWYLLVTDGTRTDGYGVQVQPNAFASWQASPKGLRLLLDVRAGSSPVELGSRRLELCRLVARRGQAGETPFAAGRAFCRLMCPVSRLPKKPVYGYNDWYCAYGRNTATNFLADVESLVGFMRAAGGADPANPPFAVADDGWQLKDSCGDRPGPEGQWTGSNPRWNMPMDTFCARVRKLGARPGVWYRPLMPWKTMPESWKTRGRAAAIWKEGDFTIDPTAPGLADRIRSEMARFRSWGVELVKIDYITYDWNTHWGFDLGERVIDHDAAVWQDRSRTGAETILGLYRAMREGAGDMLVIGCNAIDHFAAGLFELQRTGDDTSGLEWARTRKMGPNTLGMRAIHNNIFYQCDGDCVGLVKEGDVPWDKNRQWLELVAASGTSLFTSWKRGNARTEDVRLALGRAWARASRATETAEPLDWLETLRPAVWKTMYGKLRFDWDVKPIADGHGTVDAEVMRRLAAAERYEITQLRAEPDHVFVEYVLRPTTSSYIRCQLAMPVSAAKWNGRLWGFGNGGPGGHVNVGVGLTKYGNAVVHTDMGTSKGVYGNREALVDFGWRATHLMTVSAKKFVTAAFGKAPTRCYFLGGSTGGGQGFHEALRFPEDYDGILSYVPANTRLPLHVYFAWNLRLQCDRNGKRVFSKQELSAVAQAAIDYFADKDKPFARGRFLTDSRYTPEAEKGILALARKKCPSLAAGDKLERLHKMFTGPVLDGQRVHAGVPFSAALEPAAGNQWMLRWYLGPDRALHTVTDAELAAWLREWGPICDACGAGFAAFAKRGGKMIVVGGLEDSIVPYPSMIDWYERAAEELGGRAKLEDACRLYLLPGRAHGRGRGCGNVLNDQRLLVDWVEKGIHPNDVTSDLKSGEKLTIRPYPACF